MLVLLGFLFFYTWRYVGLTHVYRSTTKTISLTQREWMHLLLFLKINLE